jgi:DNA-directed RNA polymerase
MNDSELLDIQIAHEQEMLDRGVSRYRKHVTEAQQKGQESDTQHGSLLMKKTIDKLITGADAYILSALQGEAGKHATAAKILSTLDIEVCSYVALKTVINSLTTRVTMTNVCVQIGQNIHDQHLCDEFKLHNKLWFKSTMDYMAKRKASRIHKKMTLRKAADKANTSYNTWTTPELYHIGAKLVDLIIQTTGMVYVDKVHTGRKRTTHYLAATPEILDWIRQLNTLNEVLTPEALPFVIPPKNRKTVMSEVMHSSIWKKRLPLIKTRNRQLLEELEGDPDLQKTIDAVNIMQNTAFRINKRIVKLQRMCWEGGEAWGGIPSRNEAPMPLSPYPDVPTHTLNDAEKKVLFKYKKKRQMVHERNASALSKKIAFERSLIVAERFSKFSELFFIYQTDYRGRIYPVAQFLSPQGTSVIKAQMVLANGQPIETYEELRWLYHHAANCFGYDKKTINERVRLIEQMMDEILAIDADPLTNSSWKDCSDPWGFLAACFEISQFQREGYGFISHISINLDATNSGLQIYSAMLRDEVGAAATNVIPTDSPADVYRDVAEITERKLAEEVLRDTDESVWAREWLESGQVDRSLCKKPCMTKVYSSTLFSCRDSVRDELMQRFDSGNVINPFLNDDDAFIKATFYLAKTIWSSISECVVSADQAMDWMQKIAREVSKIDIPIMWQTPTGFKVVQSYPEMKSLRIQTHIDGQVVRPRMASPDYSKVDKKRAASGICPNFVHALDSSFMVQVILNCANGGSNNGVKMKDFWMIHDSFGTTVKNAALLDKTLREVFVAMFEENDVLAQFRESMLKVLPKVPLPPKRGNLSLKGVLKSKYFFS